MTDFFRRLFRSSDQRHPLDADSDALPIGEPGRQYSTPSPISSKVLAIIHNPVASWDGTTVRQAYNWNDPDKLMQGYISDVRHASGVSSFFSATRFSGLRK